MILQKVFLVRQCKDSFFKNRSRACLQYQIQRCSAPCVGLIEKNEYDNDVNSTMQFLAGKNKRIVNGLVKRMEQCSEQKKYEEAFERFEAKDFKMTADACLFIQQTYPGSKLEDKIVFLMALSKAGLHENEECKNILTEFISTFPASPLLKEASELLKLINK